MKRTLLTVLVLSVCVMAQTTPNLHLNLPAVNAPNWNIPLNANFTLLDSFLSGATALPGLNVGVSGTGCGKSFFLTNTEASPTNPNKYWRINKTTGALELMDSACLNVLLSVSDTGVMSNSSSPQLTAGAGVALLLQGSVCTSSTVCTATLQGGRNSLGGGVFNGLDAVVQGGSGAVSGIGGGVQFKKGTDFSGGQPSIKTDMVFGQYNNIATVSNGVPSELATVDLTAQTAAISTATLYAVPATGAGQYRVGWNAKVTTVAGTSSTLGALTIVYTDPDGVVQTITAPASIAAGTIATTSTGNTTTTVLLGLPLMLNCKASTNITYAMAYASNAANIMAYNLHIKLEAQ